MPFIRARQAVVIYSQSPTRHSALDREVSTEGTRLPKYAPQYQRSLRLEAVAAWASAGLGSPRAPFPIEKAFVDRLAQRSVPAFRPLPLNDSESVAYHREVSLLIDAFDAFPNRVDLSFDSTWRAFEAGLHDLRGPDSQNTTLGLSDFARSLGADEAHAMDLAIAALPQQALEFLIARWIDGPTDGNKLSRRLANAGSTGSRLSLLRELLRAQYDLSDLQDRRKAARLLLLAMRGETINLQGTRLELSADDRVLVLVSGLLFDLRNVRAHGAVPSPFTSSAASLRTFTLPYYAFVITYFLYMTTAIRRGHLGSHVTAAALRTNLLENLAAARDVMGRHWYV